MSDEEEIICNILIDFAWSHSDWVEKRTDENLQKRKNLMHDIKNRIRSIISERDALRAAMKSHR